MIDNSLQAMSMRRRPESHVALVSHGDILLSTLVALSSRAPPEVKPLYTKPFRNAEMRTFVLSDLHVAPVPDPLAFSGGLQCLQ